MKNKISKDPFEVAGWGKEGVTDPQQVFAEAFRYMDIQNLRRETKKIVTYALCAKLYQQRVPCNVLVDMKVIRSVLKAAYALRKATGAGVIATGEETLPAWQYCRGGGRLSHWSDFPRSLSLKEYCSPFRVFKKLFRRCHLRQYVQDWETLVEAALSPYEMDLQLNPVRICTSITKLLEAAHLIWIREGGGGLLKSTHPNNPTRTE